MLKGLEYSESVFRQLRLLELTIDTLSEGVAVGHKNGGIVLFNSAARELMGFGIAKEAQAKWSEHYGIFYADGRTLVPPHELAMVQALAGKTVKDFEMVIRNAALPQGRNISANAYPIPPDMAVVVFRDITAEKQRAEALLAAKEAAEAANRAKTEFLANMSHEIRTPLTAILGFAELLSDGTPETPEDRAVWISSIQGNAEHLSSLVDGVLDLSKIESGMFTLHSEWVLLRRCLNEALESQKAAAEAKGLEFNVRIDDKLPEWIYADSVAVRRILLNIVGNALKFTNRGKIDIHVTSPKAGLIQILVEDGGVGISAKSSHRLFKPFSQGDSSMSRRFGGTGLGLIVSQRLAQLMGGDVRLLRSDPGIGSTFSITFGILPRKPIPLPSGVGNKMNHTASNDLASLLETEPLKGKRILVVEDNPDIQMLLCRLLTRAGAQVLRAEDGQSGIHMAQTESVDVVLMDIQMPVVDGYEATKRLRAAGFFNPIVALTAHALTEERLKCLAAGCNDYLSKPVNPLHLVSTLKALADEDRSGKRDSGSVLVGVSTGA